MAEAQDKRSRPLLRVFLWTITLVVLAITGFGIYQWITWPDVRALIAENPESTAFIDTFRERTDEATPLHWTWVDWDTISPTVKAAVLVAEDIEFFTHEGFSFAEIRAAIRDAMEGGESLRGASTLTQQLAKNLWLSPSRNPLRKVKEAILTVQLERTLAKERLFELYLNVAEFGVGIYGVEAAANIYFAKSAQTLQRREAALLAASLSRPSRWNPHSTTPGYLARADRIEGLMISHEEWLARRVGLLPERIAVVPFEQDTTN